MKNLVPGITSRFIALAGIGLLSAGMAAAQTAMVPPTPAGIADGAGIVKSKQWALVLGKALFWDQQAGSDGIACASCHLHAGADTRLRNQINPGFNDITAGVSPGGDIATGGDMNFGSLWSNGSVAPGHMPSGGTALANYLLQAEDFPLHRLADETDRNSAVVTTTNDRVSSQGAFSVVFDSVTSNKGNDKCGTPDASVFHVGNLAARQVEPRNTPTTINAAFNNRNFWDGRANNLFNGVGPFGMRDIQGDPNKRLIVADKKGNVSPTYVQLENASLASQAVAPVISSVEMSCSGRTFADVGHKLLWNGNNARVALDSQIVDTKDSILGPYAKTGKNATGLKNTYTYDTLIQKAFDPKWWNAAGKYKIANGAVTKDKTGYTQMEINMPLFWGVAIMMYEDTLVSNQSEFDSLVAAGHLKSVPRIGVNTCQSDGTVDPLLLRGCNIFFGIPNVPADFSNPNHVPSNGGGCAFCHGPADTFSEAAALAGAPYQPFIEVTDIHGHLDIRDLGFANIGVRPAFTDQMNGREDSYGNPLSFGRQYKNYINHGNDPSYILDPLLLQALASGNMLSPRSGVPQFDGTAKLEVDGASKVPSVRNVALTPPYFSWGGYSTLRQVMKLYNRGMSVRNVTNGMFDAHGTSCITGDDSGSGPDGNTPFTMLQSSVDCDTNVTGAIVPLGLSDCDANGAPNGACLAQGVTTDTDDLAAVIRFMKSLTDTRVQCDAAPFDHPQITITNGHLAADKNKDGLADDITFSFPAVGAAGYNHTASYCIPNAGDLFAAGMQSRSGGAKATIP